MLLPLLLMVSALTMLVVILLAVVVQAALRRVPTYGVAVIWALVAVAVENWGVTPPVAYLAAGGAVFMLWPTVRAYQRK